MSKKLTSIFYIISLLSVQLSGCITRQTSNFTNADLLINNIDMPDGWELAEYSDSSNDDEGQESGAYIMFYYTITPYFVRGGEDIYRYRNSILAGWHFRRFEKNYFNDAGHYRTTPWQVPEDFQFSSSLTKKWRFGCAGSSFNPGLDNGTERTICNFLAQYKMYLVFFRVTTEVDGEYFITIDEINSIIKVIDDKMAEHLSQ